MDIRKIKKLIEMLLEAPDIGEIEVQEGEETVRISKLSKMQPPAAAPPATPPPVQTVQVAAEPAGPQGTESMQTAADAVATEEGEIVPSPMVGTYYAGSAPSKPPFVKIGSKVGQGDVLCIIEAMKIMNQIESPHAGTVVQIMLENGDPVEYGQPLFVIRT